MRPKNEDGVSLPMPHVRLPKDELTKLRHAGFVALSTDARSTIWTAAHKLTVLDKVIDHVVDGDKIPKWVWAADPDRPENHALMDLWRLAEAAVRAARQQKLAA